MRVKPNITIQLPRDCLYHIMGRSYILLIINERRFSKYKHILSDCQRRFLFENLKKKSIMHPMQLRYYTDFVTNILLIFITL